MKDQRPSGFWHSFACLWAVLSSDQRRGFWALSVLTLVAGASEVVTVGAVVPFIALLANSSARFAWLSKIFVVIGAKTASEQLTYSMICLCAAAIFSCVLRLLLTRWTQNFTAEFGHQLSVEMQRRMIFQPYSWQVRHNSSEQIAGIERIEVLASGVLQPVIQASSAAILLLLLLAVLLVIAPLATLVSAAALGMTYLLIGSVARRNLDRYSETFQAGFGKRIKILQEAVSGIRDVILDGSQDRLVDQFRSVDQDLARARANAMFISAVPRTLIEPAGIIIIAGLALLLSRHSGGISRALPILGAIALGAQRMLPLVQQLFHAWSNFAGNRSVIEDVLEGLTLPIANPRPTPGQIPFEHTIEFRNVSFTYEGRGRAAVHNLNFTIDLGSRVALMGPTGSGKSTTADLLMGLLEPTSGTILVDGVPLTSENLPDWRSNIAHVPQLLFIADATLAENITLGSGFDAERMRRATDLAQLSNFVASLDEGFDTRIGERGLQISGGQRQRLAIARAMYKDAPLLIFDEATSALDESTEASLLRALGTFHRSDRTIVIIAHRSSTIEGCDAYLKLNEGRLVGSMPPAQRHSH